ncbi:hypothetical protein B566_EDAN005352 [Ephemera danica]|nr:hypothetical protein B566_EDAN005352 [Ephemera danica]
MAEEEEEDDEEGVEREAVVNRRYMVPSSSAPLLHTAAWQEASDEDEDETSDEAGGKRGPKLLSPLSEDCADPSLAAGLTDCWALRDVSGVLQASAVLVRSLIWPGAFTLVAGRRLEHIYIGWGVKTQSRHRCPPFPPAPALEPADLVLTRDPTPADEAAAQENNEDDEDEEDESE